MDQLALIRMGIPSQITTLPLTRCSNCRAPDWMSIMRRTLQFSCYNERHDADGYYV
jgi:hypothetical protein